MKRTATTIIDAGELRRRAEAQVSLHPVVAGPATDAVVHELQVHQVELALQYEALAAAHDEITRAFAGYAALYEDAPVGYLTLGTAGDIRKVNRHGEQLLGADRAQLLGRRFALWVVEDGRSAFAHFLAEVFAHPARATCECEVGLDDASRRVLELTAVATADGDECRVVARDITSLVHELRARAQLQASLAQADRLASLGMLAAGVAHELNNPLCDVLGTLQSLVDELPEVGQLGPGELADVVTRARDALSGTQRIREVARGLGTFARVSEAARSTVDVRDAIETAITMSVHELKYRARLVRELAEVPRIWAVEGELAQVFLNLLINAAHAIDEGDVEHHTITVRTRHEGGYVVVEVADTGVGIPAANLTRIFEPFFTTKGATRGSGLGLAICQDVVTALGGDIAVDSAPGHGARFVVRLPVSPAAVALPAPSPPASSAPVPRGRILVVDDEASIRTLLQRLLGLAHDVVAASSGAARGAGWPTMFRRQLLVVDAAPSSRCTGWITFLTLPRNEGVFATVTS